ncbi:MULTISPECIES: NADH-quinone oxidoreductase subunit J family protein [Sorangium]|uniref:NADH-quinone oxidoreductase subunit J n=1 Tax=Sorangium cellulosum (strain So ce56) TaxID=448385 RepID=A9EX75_SORC5|nr:NADH-quinone oxidoreductase subunit J [Sorangium cellulosum]CAN94385.1 putative NADH dehydrogenase (ubiquinone) [Sorangium cellulosum So ce56]
MKIFEFAFFGLASLLVLLGGLATVAARNPIRGAMGLLTSIVGIAGLYLMLSAEFLAAIQILVYAGAIVILFLFVIMLLGPSATSPRDARTAVPRYVGAGVLGASSIGALALVASASKPGVLAVPAAPESLGTIEGLGHELFTKGIVPFELSGALLLVAVIGAVAVARGKQVDPTLLPAGEGPDTASPEPGDQGASQPGALAGHATLSAKEPH